MYYLHYAYKLHQYNEWLTYQVYVYVYVHIFSACYMCVKFHKSHTQNIRTVGSNELIEVSMSTTSVDFNLIVNPIDIIIVVVVVYRVGFVSHLRPLSWSIHILRQHIVSDGAGYTCERVVCRGLLSWRRQHQLLLWQYGGVATSHAQMWL